MSEFSLDSNINITIEKLAELSAKQYDGVSTLIYTAVSLNSPFDEMIFLYKYISNVATKYQSILNYCGYFTHRETMQKYVDTIATLTMATISHYSRTGYNLPETIRFFFNQFLKIVYEKTEFSIINIKLLNDSGRIRFKVLVEPICSDKLTEKESYQAAKLMLMMLTYFESPDRCISVSIIKSELWTDFRGYIPEIIDDNIFPGMLEQYPALYKIIFKRRHGLLKELGLNCDDVSETIKLPDEIENVLDDIMESSSSDIEDIPETVKNMLGSLEDSEDEETDIEEDEEDLNEAELHASQYSQLIEMMYLKLTGGEWPVTVDSAMINLNHMSDIPVYLDTFKKLITNSFDMWTIYNKVKEHYESGEIGESKSFFNPVEKEYASDTSFSDKFIETLNKLFSKEPSLDSSTGNSPDISVKKIDDSDKLINLNNILHQNTATKDKDGFSKFIFDYHSSEEIKSILDISNYISDTVNIYLKHKKINQSVLNKIISSYNKADMNIVDIKNNSHKNNYSVKFNMNDQLYRFTISKKDGIIELIEYKEE